MRYTVWSRGRLIGETDLGFAPLIPLSRSGSFHPNAEGERLMPVAASVSPAMRAYLHRNAVDASGNGFVLPELHGSTLFADLAEAFQHLESLDLELRREDGSVVPTACIGLQDTHRLLALAAEEEKDATVLSEEDLDEESVAEGMEGLEQVDADALDGDPSTDAFIDSWVDDFCTAWESEHPREFPRYQIHVELRSGDAIP
jgi:hypothetical protein